MHISVDMSVWVSRHRTMSCDIHKPTSESKCQLKVNTLSLFIYELTCLGVFSNI